MMADRKSNKKGGSFLTLPFLYAFLWFAAVTVKNALRTEPPENTPGFAIL